MHCKRFPLQRQAKRLADTEIEYRLTHLKLFYPGAGFLCRR